MIHSKNINSPQKCIWRIIWILTTAIIANTTTTAITTTTIISKSLNQKKQSQKQLRKREERIKREKRQPNHPTPQKQQTHRNYTNTNTNTIYIKYHYQYTLHYMVSSITRKTPTTTITILNQNNRSFLITRNKTTTSQLQQTPEERKCQLTEMTALPKKKCDQVCRKRLFYLFSL